MKASEITRHLRPRGRIQLVVRLDVAQDEIDVRPTSVYRTHPRASIVTAQSFPPIPESMVGQQIQVAFLAGRKAGKLRRYGYETRILEVLRDYRLGAADRRPALALGWPVEGVREMNLRLHHRVPVGPADGLEVRFIGFGDPLRLVDLSLGGALIDHEGRETPRVGQEVLFDLAAGDRRIPSLARILRVEKQDGRRARLGLRFVLLTPEARARLWQELRAVLGAKPRLRQS